jgi:hypothetical protein
LGIRINVLAAAAPGLNILPGLQNTQALALPLPSLQLESCWINNRSVHVCILQAVKSSSIVRAQSQYHAGVFYCFFFTISQRMISLSPAGRVLFFNNEIEALQRKKNNP